MANKNKDNTKRILEDLLSEIYKEQAKETASKGESYLIGQDNQLLGTLTDRQDKDSILNKYGPYGSKYSTTSIFNNDSQYGSKHGSYSVNNPRCGAPPLLFIKKRFVGYVSENNQVPDQISTKSFLHLLENKLEALANSEIDFKKLDKEK